MTISKYIGLLTIIFFVTGTTSAIAKHGILSQREGTRLHIWLTESEIKESAPIASIDPHKVLKSLGLMNVALPYSLKLQADRLRPSGRVLTYGQYYQDIRVIGASVKVCLNRQEVATSWAVNIINTDYQLSRVSWLDKFDAIDLAKEAINLSELRSSSKANKVILTQNGIPVFCWKIDMPGSVPLGDWEVYLACDNGEVFLIEDRLMRFNGVGMVFSPDPKTVLHDTTLVDDDDNANAVPEEAYQQVELIEISLDDDNQYILSGPWVDTEPTEDRARMEDSNFNFNREDNRFEEVMVYYHIDNQARYYQSLGFGDYLPDPLLVNVNGVDEDVSFYSPQTGILTTGTGGVDDAEDADVLVHEYGHAIIYNIIGDWRGGESELLSEGLCDYFAGDYSLNIDDEFQPFDIYDWDGHNEFWDGRVLNSTLKYDDIAELNHHEAGQLWSSLLTEVLLRSNNRDSWNEIVLDHIAALSDSTTIPLAAEALLQSDQELSEGAFRHLIIQACEDRLIFAPGLHSPTVFHEPLNDIEDVNADRVVQVNIRTRYQLDADRLWLIYASEANAPDTLLLEINDDIDDTYFTTIPSAGEETDIEYYFVATDTAGVFTIDPPGAPLIGYRYHIGADRTPPTIFHVDTLRTTVFGSGEVQLTVRAIDNIGIDRVGIKWFDYQMNEQGDIDLTPVQDNVSEYTGLLRWNMGVGGVIFYQVYAIDSSEAGNISTGRALPMDLENEAMIETFESENHRWTYDNWERIQDGTRDSSYVANSHVEEKEDLPITTILSLEENWDLTAFYRFRLYFWDRHNFDEDSGESGAVEISTDGGESWEELLELTGIQRWWRRYEIDLDAYTGEGFDNINIRFKTIIDENDIPENGWYIDEIYATTRTIVSADDSNISQPLSFSLSNPFPNPNNGLVTVSYQFPRSGIVRLFDMNGREVESKMVSMGSGKINFRTDKLSSGVYIILAQTDINSIQKSIVIIK